MANQTNILEHKQILQKINRIAYQIYEDHHQESQITIAGIASNGYLFAKLLKNKVEEISTQLKVELIELKIDKKNPIESEIELGLQANELEAKSIILVDDVLNSGRTLIYGMQAFLKAPLKKLSVAVLVNRSHKRFPVNANYVGMSLATTLQEHIEVSFEDENNFSAYLS